MTLLAAWLAMVSDWSASFPQQEVSRIQKPSRRAGDEAWKEYQRMTKLYNLSQRFVQTMGQLRQQLDAAGGPKKILVLAADGSFCNRTCLRAPRVDRPRSQRCPLVFSRAPAFPPLL